MDTEQAAALRKPFPRESIGKLPKGGTMLDYVGHAATTDRLLAVDPLWSWEPFSTDANGLPALDSKNNLWIRLTICGVTRIGVGDGTSAKIIVGDAIRNAAMRFGVALDLWSKEELEGSHDEDAPKAEPKAPAVTRTMSRPARQAPASEPQDDWMPPADAGPRTGRPSSDNPNLRSDKQSGMLHALLKEQGMGERVAALAYMSDKLNREVDTSTTLTKRECSTIIDALKAAS